jgi:NAD(P)-dependent dehydrogenase (short-subunit alcohol dehydrogenase family)
MTIPSLKAQRVVVIGGGSGIGFAVAAGALAEGAEVVIGSRGADKIAAAAARLGAGASGLPVDVKDDASVAAFFDEVGAFEHLVFTAGDWNRPGGGTVADLDLATAPEAMSVRFWGALRAIKQARNTISAQGSITLTDGMLAHRPMKGALLSTAFAGAAEHLTRGLAIDLAPIRVNAVCPGLVLTEMIAAWPKEAIQRFVAAQPIARGADPDEVAQAYLYLMRGGYTTGQVIVVDGGRMLV